MKRKLFALMSLILIFCFLSACMSPVAPDPSKPQEEENAEPSSEPSDNVKDANITVITGYTDDGSTAKGLNVYDSFDYDITQDGINDKIELYTGAKKDQNGEWAFDDGQEWVLVAQVGAASYRLFNRRYVQNGKVSYSLFKAKDGVIHILVTCQEGTKIETSDFVYAVKGNGFEKTPVYSSDSINFIHEA